MAFKFLLIIAIVAAEDSKTLFKWDIEDLETVFCENSMESYKMEKNINNKMDRSEKLDKEEANEYLKKGRRHMQIWPWEYHDSFEGECIEEICKPGEITEFCSRKNSVLGGVDGEKLIERRSLRYTYCEKHVNKTVNSIKETSNKDKADDKPIEAWRKELTPARLFRGWWEELKKAYKRFCLQDKTDCARRCNVEHGTCRLRENRQAPEAERWVYGCSCDPGYFPYASDNHDDQKLCSQKVENDPSSLKTCGPLNTIGDIFSKNEDGDDTIEETPINHDYLCQNLEPGFTNCTRDDSSRKRRVVPLSNDISIDARNSYFPSAVEIMHTPYCNLKRKTDCKKVDKPNKKWVDHVCGGTLLVQNQNGKTGKTNMVVTAAHCFCAKTWDLTDTQNSTYTPGADCTEDTKNSCIRIPKVGHYFVRIGIIDKSAQLNLIPKPKGDYYTVTEDAEKKWIDVQVKQIAFKSDSYTSQTNCDSPNTNGKDDLAVLILDAFIDVTDMKSESVGLRNHVKPACSIYEHHKASDSNFEQGPMFIGNNRCFVAGWGNTKNATSQFSLADTLKYTNVEIVDPNECKNAITTDQFIQDENNHNQIICGKGYKANTCGGDSGGGLYCFDRNGERYYFMGPLHGGTKDCQANKLMYFTNINYGEHTQELQRVAGQAQMEAEVRTGRSVDEL